VYEIIEGADLAESWPTQIIVISLATLANAHYLIRRKKVSLLALGLWQREMAPPSAAEIVQLLVLRAAHSALERGVWNEIHAGTRACLFDFTANLEDTRHMALAGVGVCSACRRALMADGYSNAPEEIRRIVERTWLGDRDRPGTPAAIMASLGYDLYLTKGFSPTAGERALQIVREDGVKELLKVASGVLLLAILIMLGFKVRETSKADAPAAKTSVAAPQR
jgi:hypothetical protein